MGTLHHYALCALSTLAFLAPANAAEMTPMAVAPMFAPAEQGGNGLTVDELVSHGQECMIHYRNGNMANEAVTIDIDDGLDGGSTQQVVIQLDQNGEGTGSWTPPAEWNMAVFKAPGVDAESRIIL